MFYKHHNKLAWKGPSQALGQDGPVIHIRHSRHYIKSHSCIVQLTKPNSNNDNTKTLKYWVGVQGGQSYLMGRRCLFSLGWPTF